MSHLCPICRSTEEKELIYPKELLYGTREMFEYAICHECGVIFLTTEITDFSKYYKKDYHCFDDLSNISKWKQYALNKAVTYNFNGKGLLGNLIVKIFKSIHGYIPEPNVSWIGKVIHQYNSTSQKTPSILDIGCGGGKLLRQLKYLGFNKLTGVDPYGESSQKDISIIKKDIHTFLESTTEKFDIIILSHVLEHTTEHEKILRGIKNILQKDGVIILAMPVIGKAFKKFKENWYSIDAPRHVILHSEKSFRQITNSVGLKISNVIHEENAWNIFASYMYEWDISNVDIAEQFIKNIKIKEHIVMADNLNNLKDGGSSVTYFLTH